MAPMAFLRLRDNADLIAFEDHLLRYILLFFSRAAHHASKLEYEEKFLTIYRELAHSRSKRRRYGNLASLADLIWRYIIDTRMVVRTRSISRLPGLKEFCQFLRYQPWLREQWEPIILSCTCESWSTWVEKEPRRPNFTILRVAAENWEWSCFRHYRDSFRHWAISGNPCSSCSEHLRLMARNVEYDMVEVTLRNYDLTIEFLKCLPLTFTRTYPMIPSLEPFIMILKQAKNARWLAFWAPLIHLHAGFTVAEIYRTYIQNSQERDGIEDQAATPRRLLGTMFEVRDLQHVMENVQTERILLGNRLAMYQRRPNRANEAENVAATDLRT